ncbi:MAG: PBS lyase [Methanomicrobiales archaeon HGW-Methanomicrobiales-4]|nr:MAG: PBS lyase [Methanomicrobiales archaeon HGW-Methanomicrobiales-4]
MDNSVLDQMAILISGFRSQEKDDRATCMQKIVQYGSEAVPLLTHQLLDQDWKVRYRAAESLGMIKSDDAVPALIMICSDKKDHVRYMAAKALGLIKSPDAVPVLIQLLSDEHLYTRGISSEALAAIRDHRGKKALEMALVREEDPTVQERISQSLILMNKKE